jgi:hypothetical protein
VRWYDPSSKVKLVLVALHLLDQAKHLLELLGVFLNVSRQDWQHVEVVTVDTLQLTSKCIADLVDLTGLSPKAIWLKLLHKLGVAFLNEVLLSLWAHELQLLASLIVAQGVYKKIEVVDLFNLGHEFADLRDKLLRIDIVNQINVDLVLP